MSDKPTTLPQFATDGAAEVETPPTGKLDIGWVEGELPPAGWFNWLSLHVYLWILWIKNGVLQRSSISDNSPLWTSADRDGNPRHYVSPNGYFMGPATQEVHRWGPIALTTNITTGNNCSRQGAAVFADTNTNVKVISGESAGTIGGGPQLTLTVTSAASGDRALVLSEYGGGTPSNDQPISDLDDNIVEMEWVGYVSSTTLTGIEYASGLHNFASHSHAGLGLGSNRFVQFYAAAGNTNWLCRCAAGGVITTEDSGIAVVAGVIHSFRIELHGANTALGASIARFFVDGVLVSEMSSDDTDQVPSGGSTMGMMHWAGGSPASDRSYSVSTCRLAWTERRGVVAPI